MPSQKLQLRCRAPAKQIYGRGSCHRKRLRLRPRRQPEPGLQEPASGFCTPRLVGLGGRMEGAPRTNTASPAASTAVQSLCSMELLKEVRGRIWVLSPLLRPRSESANRHRELHQWISGSVVEGAPTEEPRPDASNARSQRPATRATGVSRDFACVLNTCGYPRCFAQPGRIIRWRRDLSIDAR
jgi:hypothetical protein